MALQEAIDRKVDYIEMDVVSTADKVLVTRHDVMLDESTNIKEVQKFKGHNSTKEVDGVQLKGFFTLDFNWTEIQELRARQRLPFRDSSFDDLYGVPSLAEVLALVKSRREQSGSQVGVYIETKNSDYHRSHGIELEELLVKELKEADLLHDPEAVYLQSFSIESLKKLHALLEAEGAQIPMTWLLSCDSRLPSDKEISEFAEFGTALGPDKKLLAKIDYDVKPCGRQGDDDAKCYDVVPGQTCIGRLLQSPEVSVSEEAIVHLARKHKLQLHAYTFRNEGMYMAIDFKSDPERELEFYTKDDGKINADGVFVDCPETAMRVFGKTEVRHGNRESLSKYWPLFAVLAFFGAIVGTITFLRLYHLIDPNRAHIRNGFERLMELSPFSKSNKDDTSV